MKSAFPALLVLALTTPAAHAASFQIEAHAFHSNLRLHMKDAVHTLNGEEFASQGKNNSFQEAPGGGFAFVGKLDDYLSLGLGYDRARYYPGSDVTLDKQTLSGFVRWNLYEKESGRLHLMTGVSQHSLTGKGEVLAGEDATFKYTPVMNYDVGLGYTWTVDMWTIGLAYGYSDTFGHGNSQTVLRSRTYDELGLVASEVKTKIRNFNIEDQTFSFNFGIIL